MLGVGFAVAGDIYAVRDDVRIEAGDHGDSGRGVDVPRDDGVQVPDGELGIEGS